MQTSRPREAGWRSGAGKIENRRESEENLAVEKIDPSHRDTNPPWKVTSQGTECGLRSGEEGMEKVECRKRERALRVRVRVGVCWAD